MDIKPKISRVIAMAKEGEVKEAGGELIDVILQAGIHGTGPFKGAAQIADECSRHAAGSTDEAIKRVIRTHRRIVTTAGFGTGLGGFTTMAVAIPTDVTVFYVQATRMVAAIAHSRGYDINSEEVKSLIAVSLLGAAGNEVLAKFGVDLTTKASLAALKKLPGAVLTKINQRVGFRLITKFGSKGLINLSKLVPVGSAGVGAAVNATAITGIAKYAKSNFK